jgi:hypothetical protein
VLAEARFTIGKAEPDYGSETRLLADTKHWQLTAKQTALLRALSAQNRPADGVHLRSASGQPRTACTAPRPPYAGVS